MTPPAFGRTGAQAALRRTDLIETLSRRNANGRQSKKIGLATPIAGRKCRTSMLRTAQKREFGQETKKDLH
jgi:hypothetical protein